MRANHGTPGNKGRLGQLARRPGRALRFAGLGLVGLLIGAYLLLYVVPLPAPEPLTLRPESTKIYDRNGRLLYDSAGPNDSLVTFVPLSQLPQSLKDAVIATEDAGFYDHSGIDPVAIGRAALDATLHFRVRSGASTITQQLARNVYMDEEERASTDPRRKLKEWYLALRIERAYTKDEILEAYLNRVYFGNLAYGVEAASQTYFGKGARDLDLAEASFLTGLLQSPSHYDPFLNLEGAKARQRTVLSLMVEKTGLSNAAASAALNEPLSLNDTPFPMKAPHFVASVLQQLPELIGEEALAGSGLEVHTSLDLSLQEVAEAAVARQMQALRDKNVTTGAVVSLDPQTGEILAMVGSADYFDTSRDGNVNGALAERQPGSAIKTVVYAAALEQGMTPASQLLDVPTNFTTRGGEVYSPLNYDLTFHGPVPLREALASSYNVPAVQVLERIGVEAAFKLGSDLGLTSFRDPRDYDLALTLGGGEVRLIDLTSSYAALAAGGLLVQPVSVLRVETAGGSTLYEAPRYERPRVLSEATAYLISDILSDNDARAPGFGINSVLRLSMPAAVKTGTTTDFRDNWTVGYTPHLVTGVWVGNADSSPMRNVSGVDGAAPIWRDVMLAGLRNQPRSAFARPEVIEEAAVCLPSGLLPTAECRRSRVEVFAAGTVPEATDDYYRSLPCDLALVSNTVCDGRIYAFVPLEAISWARQAGVDLPPVPPYDAAPSRGGGQAPTGASGRDALRLVSPPDGLTLSLSREVRLADQMLPVQVQPSAAVQYVEVWVNDAPVQRLDSAPYRFSWPLSQGSYSIQARAITETGQEIWSQAARLQVLPP